MLVCAAASLSGFRAASEPNTRIAIQSYASKIPEEGPNYASYLLRTMGPQAPLHGDALRAFLESRMSRDPGVVTGADELRAAVTRGRLQFIEGEYAQAIRLLGDARHSMLQRQALMAADQTLRSQLHRATLFLAHAYLRLQDNAKAVSLVSEVVRSYPDRELSLVQHGPQLVDLYKRVRLDMRDQKLGSLAVVTEPAGCMVFVNERYVGLSPTQVSKLYPGKYRVYAQRPGELGRTHEVDITGENTQLNIDFGLDRALRTRPTVTLLYPTRNDMARYEKQHAITVARRLGATEVVVLGIRRYQGRQGIQATVLAVSTGRVLRSGMVAIEPTSPTPAEVKALGHFLSVGKPGAGVIVRSVDTAKSPSGPMSAAWPWTALGLGIASLAAGIPLIILDGQGTCEAGVCESTYNTMGLGLGLTIAGGAALVTSAVLFVLRARAKRASEPPPRNQAVVMPFVARHSAGVTAQMSF